MVKIFIGNLDQDTKPDELRQLFEKFGTVTESDVVKNYGFIHMDSESDARTAIDALNEYQLHGSKMKVEMSHGKSTGGGRGGGDRGGRGGGRGGSGGRGFQGSGGRGRGSFSDRGMGRGGERGMSRGGHGSSRFDPYARPQESSSYGSSQFDPYYRSYPPTQRSSQTEFDRDPHGRPPPEYYSRRTGGPSRSSAPPPPPSYDYDYDGEYQRYLRWREYEWELYWRERDDRQSHWRSRSDIEAGYSSRLGLSQSSMPLSSSRGGGAGRGIPEYDIIGKSNSTYTPQQTSLYTAFE